ncbi:cytidine deaminase [Pedobacter frigiditerrae]|uniref:Cytidine deaminase n=1 Tax=Pedobacter frigiditerrae TaxID=2530452 RepID=A0A4R0MZC6_9SPHI|nr:cytidine deaminase [Pedobacter frigiditerrae]TCC92327.1 cytidine deaminase [Pedobacter frigiditerrae]
MSAQNFTISYETFDGIEDLSETDKILCLKAKNALASSFSPYSKFKVGTAILLADEQVVLGSNQENVAYPSGLCAERVALFTIGSNYPNAVIKTMAITAQTDVFKIVNPITSCGGCLQVMIEVEKRQKLPIEVLFYCIDGQILKVKSVKNLLPFAFVEDRLER